jgi:hypothetical protein
MNTDDYIICTMYNTHNERIYSERVVSIPRKKEVVKIYGKTYTIEKVTWNGLHNVDLTLLCDEDLLQ